MGRMLDKLKVGRQVFTREVEVAPPEPQTPVQDCVVDWEIGAETPFIEVGGPGKKVEHSPGLPAPKSKRPEEIAHPPQPAQPPHPPVLEKAAVELVVAESRPLSVSLEMWPGESPAPLCIAPEIIAYHHPQHPTTKEYGALLEKILADKADRSNILLLLGINPHVDTGIVLLNLAVLAARDMSLRVVVVEARSTRAGLAQRLGRIALGGLAEVFDGSLALEQAIIKTPLPGLHLLTAGTPAKSHKLVGAQAMTWLHAWLRDRYDLVLLDGPALDDTAEIAVQAPHADGIYLVLPQGEAAPVSAGIGQSIRRMGGRMSGLIHTRF